MSMCCFIGALKYETGANLEKGYSIALGHCRAQGGPSRARARARAFKKHRGAFKRARAQVLERAQGGP